MNIALEQTEEYVNGQLKNKYGDAFIRGNNGESHNGSLCVVYDHFLVCILQFCTSAQREEDERIN